MSTARAAADSGFRRWTMSGLVAFVMMVFVVALFCRAKVELRPSSSLSRPGSLRLAVGADVAFDEQKVLSDPTPLFLPTRWNAPRRGVTRPEPGATFESFPPVFSAASEKGLNFPRLPTPVEAPDRPVDILLNSSPGSLLLGFGRAEIATPGLSERGGFVEIVAEGTGRRVLRESLVDARPPGEGAWQPMEFLVAVNAAGLVGSVRIARRSGIDAVDEYFRRYLVQTLRVGQKLAPGFYRICVGP